MNKIITLNNGKKLEIQLASFEKGHKLLKAVTREIESVKLALGLKGNMKDLMSMDVNDDAMNTIKDVVSRLIYSDTVEVALWDCMAVVLIDDKKVSRETFEDLEMRQYFLVVVKEVLVYNLAPFFGSIGSLLSGITSKITGSQKQK